MRLQSTIDLQCVECGRMIYRPAWRTRRHVHRVFCSHACRRTRVTRQCKHCGMSFEAAPSDIATRGALYCSIECRNKNRRNGVQRKCRQCGADFYLYPGAADRSKRAGDFCSLGCYQATRRSTGAYPHFGSGWRSIAAAVRDRDNHTCRDCGRVWADGMQRFCVHHLTARRHYDKDLSEANVMENLVTLCRSCHMRREQAIQEAKRRLAILVS